MTAPDNERRDPRSFRSCCSRSPPAASAHEMTMAEMELRGNAARRIPVAVGCQRQPPDRRRAHILAGRTTCRSREPMFSLRRSRPERSLSIEGVGERYSAALVKVYWRDGQSRVLHADRAPAHRAPVWLRRGPAWHGRDRRRLSIAWCRTHPERHRSPAVRCRAAVPGGV